MVGGPGRVGVNGVEVDFVNQHACAHAARQAADFTQRRFRSQDAARIMQVGENDQSCLVRDDAPNLGWIERITALISAGKMLYHRAQI